MRTILASIIFLAAGCDLDDDYREPPPPHCSAVCNTGDPPPKCDENGCICQLWNHRWTHCYPDHLIDAGHD